MRQQQPREEHHLFHGREGEREIVLVGRGERTYLWVGPVEGGKGEIYTFSGPKTLCALALAILEELE